MSRRILIVLVAFGAIAVAQRKPAPPRFAVVSIRVDPPQSGRVAIPTMGPVHLGGRYSDQHAILWSLITFAYPQYSFPKKTLVGLPDWAYGRPGSVFDFEAVAGPGAPPNMTEMREMMAAALADRFHLRFHVATRQMPVFLLEVARGGPHDMHPSAPGQQSLLLMLGPGITGLGATMDEFAAEAGALFEDRPVLNRTGLGGFYDIRVPATSGSPYAAGGIRILRLLKALGLKLVPANSSVPVMVVDNVTRPTPN